ncbi:DUF6344 domain-containing protein [Streptomyces sp. NPDC006368]|uniref:DUF6344 domain-containing protein n=1 Tax=Streptomyces sp. NPDC006368 TaxID=3156760 RepID=UPI0033A1C19F
MAAVKVTHVRSVWTAFVCLLTALLAALGLRCGTGTAAAAAPAPVSTPEGTAVTATETATATAPAPVRDRRSLPPTIKQRIHAEAHGSSPSVRRLPAVAAPDAPAGPALTDLALAA